MKVLSSNLANKICLRCIANAPLNVNKKPPSINRENMERSDILRTDAHPYKGGGYAEAWK